MQEFQQWLDATPFQELLGIRAISIDRRDGVTQLRLPYNARIARRYTAYEFHGGAIATLIDIAGASSLYAVRGYAGPTIDMRIDYLKLATGSALMSKTTLVKDGRSLALADVTICDDDARTIAVGRVALSTLKVHVASVRTSS